MFIIHNEHHAFTTVKAGKDHQLRFCFQNLPGSSLLDML